MNLNQVFLTLLFLFFSSCQSVPSEVEYALEIAGPNRYELQKVIDYYMTKGDNDRLRAAYYLIKNLPHQFHSSGKGVLLYRDAIERISQNALNNDDFNRNFTADSLLMELPTKGLSIINKVYDIHVIKSDFLIRNIEEAFKAWEYPWARHLSFDEFSTYVLPYKLKDEQPVEWRSYFQQRYSHLIDSMENKSSPVEMCKLINQDLKTWFYFSKIAPKYDLNFNELLQLRAGGCPEEVQLATYAMRAMGLPVVMDGVPLWANRNSRHDWNAILIGNQFIPFLGTEIDPGVYKVEGALPGNIKAKRAKVYRRCFSINSESPLVLYPDTDLPDILNTSQYLDVTASYIPVQSFHIPLKKGFSGQSAYLAVFNQQDWRIIDWGRQREKGFAFENVGRDIVYLPVLYDEGEMSPLDNPVLVNKLGEVEIIQPDSHVNKRLIIDRKYPTGDDNKVQIGESYELFYWDNRWVYLEKKIADSEYLTFDKVPDKALLWLHNVRQGAQERIFLFNNGKISWY